MPSTAGQEKEDVKEEQHTLKLFNLFQPSVAFYIETIYLLCNANQMTESYMKSTTELKWAKKDPKVKDSIDPRTRVV